MQEEQLEDTTISHKDEYSFRTKVILTEAFKCIKEASRYGVKVFGSFVRNVIVGLDKSNPRSLSLDKCLPNLFSDRQQLQMVKDLSLWFKTDSQADSFLMMMGKKLSVARHTILSSYSSEEYGRCLYYLSKYDTPLIVVEVIIATNLPVDNFDVNTVTYSLDNNDMWITDSPTYFINQIKERKATMLRSYVEKIEAIKGHKNAKSLLSYHKERIEKAFTSRGWIIYIPNKSFGDLFILIQQPPIDKTPTETDTLNRFIIRMGIEGRTDILAELVGISSEGQQEIYQRVVNHS